MAPEELDLPYDGELIIEDSETLDEIPVHAESFREEYQRRVSEFCDRVRKLCASYEIDYQRLRTDSPLDVAMMSYLDKRAAQ